MFPASCVFYQILTEKPNFRLDLICTKIGHNRECYTNFMGIMPKDKPVVISAESYAKKNIFKYSYVNPKILGLLSVVLLMIIGVGTGVYLTQVPSKTNTQATLETSEISFKPPAVEIDPNSEFSIDVFANANENQITSTQLTIVYDNNALDLLSISPKQFLPKVLIAPKISSGSATISLGTDGNSGINGSGVLATLSFRSKNSPTTTTQISFDEKQTRINVVGNNNNPITGLASATVTIIPTVNEEPVAPGVPDPESTSSANELTFDLNSDSQVNSVDLSILYSAWGDPESEFQKKSDVNSDGIVNGLDYSLILSSLNRK